MQNHKGALSFSTIKPNVIVGKNGTGKSALIETLALRFLAYFTGQSEFDGKYLTNKDSKIWWTKKNKWGDDYAWLNGAVCKTDNGPALYYRPNHIPGNETGVVHAMMTGYFDEARAYARMTEKKSSGEKSKALLSGIIENLSGNNLPSEYKYRNWQFGKNPADLRERYRKCGWVGEDDHQAEVLKSVYSPQEGWMPIVLMDEPEQSLDALAEAELWKAIANTNCEKVQIIVAAHSLHPILNKGKYNIIETEPGFMDSICSVMDSTLKSK